MSHIDHRGAPRKVKMELLCLGFSRTGTASLVNALEKLGYNETNHGFKISVNPKERELWKEAINAKFFGKGKPFGRAEWDHLLGHYMAVTDVPHVLFAEELIKTYPEAKVVLTMREPDRWWKSYSDTAGRALRSPVGLHPWLEPAAVAEIRAFWRLVQGALFGMTEPTAEIAKARFIEHYDQVRRMVPKERLLEYRVAEGWESLCEFLEKPVPEEPFPKGNDTQGYHEHLKRQNRAILYKGAFKYVASAVILALGIFLYGDHIKGFKVFA